MLKKCLKHEWKACWKNLTLLNGAAVFMGAVGGGGVLFSRIHELPDLLVLFYILSYAMILIAASVLTQILMIQRYYKNLFTDEGYLTNVLPVSATDHILAKMLVFGACNILNGLSVLASVSFLILPSAIQYFSGHSLILNNQAVTFSDFLNYVWTQITCVADAAFSLIGITSRLGMALFSIVGFFASLFFGILLFYAAISIGSLVSSHKILTAVLSYIGMTTVIQIFGGISIVRVFQDSTPTAVVTTSSVSTLIITVVLCVVLFLICRYILGRRLNLS